MRRRAIKPFTSAELEAWPTHRLLARLRTLHRCEESFALSDRNAGETVPDGVILFKQSKAWQTAYTGQGDSGAPRTHFALTEF
jgi:hypothetical protein